MQINKLHQLLESIKTEPDFIDLIDTNFTHHNFFFPTNTLIETASKYFLARSYEPDSKGLLKARNSIANFYKKNHLEVDPENIIITASTSESYNLIFNNFCETGDEILLPNPGYPLFDQLAEFNRLETKYYQLDPNNDWQPDLKSIKKNITNKTKFLVLISPNNPTGSVIKKDILEIIMAIAAKHKLMIIADEVFSEYVYEKNILSRPALISNDVTVFTLNGISKTFTLPDLKLAWIVVTGKSKTVAAIIEKLELANDVYLNANYLTQTMLPDFFNIPQTYPIRLHKHLTDNLELIATILAKHVSLIKYVKPIGGIHLFLQIQIPEIDEEDFVVELLETKHILVHPGYFYDYSGDKKQINLVISFIQEKHQLEDALMRLINFAQKQHVKYA